MFEDPLAFFLALAVFAFLFVEVPLLFELSPLEFAALARLDEFLFAREALLVLVDRVAVLCLVRADLAFGLCEVVADRVDEGEGDGFVLFEVVVVLLEGGKVVGLLVEDFGGAFADGNLLLYVEVLKDLGLELVLADGLAADGTGFGAEGEEAVEARLAHLVVALRDHQPEFRVQVAVVLADGTLVGV